MLAKDYRIRDKGTFLRIFKKGNSFYTKNFIYRWMENRTPKAASETRFAFIVSNKVEKRAVYRNKIRRQLQAIAQKLISRVKKGYDIVIITKGGILEVDFQEIENQFEYFINKNQLNNDQ